MPPPTFIALSLPSSLKKMRSGLSFSASAVHTSPPMSNAQRLLNLWAGTISPMGLPIFSAWRTSAAAARRVTLALDALIARSARTIDHASGLSARVSRPFAAWNSFFFQPDVDVLKASRSASSMSVRSGT